jgi:dihydropteroate synthase
MSIGRAIMLRGRALVPGARPFVVGILNVTPDSFSDGGRFYESAAAIEAGCRMTDDGADVIDIGGESTRPGSAAVSADEQVRRTQPVIAGLAKRFGPSGPAISIDTRSAAVARAALDSGASIVNDISGLRDDPEMAGLVAERGAGLILMHMKGTPADMQANPVYDDVVGEIRGFLAQRIETAVCAGIPGERIIADPGIGFGKTVDHNLELIRRVHEFRSLGVPVMVGPSRKRFIGQVLGIENPADRLMGTMAVVAAVALAGVEMVRVHDVRDARQVVDMCTAIGR